MAEKGPKTMANRSPNTGFVVAIRVLEIIFVILIPMEVMYYWGNGEYGLKLFGIWDVIAAFESTIFGIMLLAFTELEMDSRIKSHERDFVPAALWIACILSIFLMLIVVGINAHYLANYTIRNIFYDIAIFFVDVTWGPFTILLFLAQRRLNRAARTAHD